MVNGFPHMLDRSVVRRGTSALALVTAFAISAAAQTPALGDVARKEAERRKALPPSAKVYTNKDLPESARKSAPPATAAPPDAAPVETADAKPEEQQKPAGEQKDEAWWKARITQAREELRRNEVFAQALQSRINALTRDFTNAFNAPRQRQIGEQRKEAVAELDRVLQDIEAGKKQIADIEEEARKAGVPPGWLR
jgi:hypothetical protein